MIKLVSVKHPGAGIKLVAIEDPKIPVYTKGFIDGLGAGCRLAILVAFCFEGYGKELSRLLSEVTGPGRNPDALTIKSSY